MKSVLELCQPRPELIAGNFNPDIFTASLSPIIEFYQGRQGIIDSIYTNAELFFREATFPTQGLRSTLNEVFGRLAGDVSMPAIHRLETAFGGGKTHALISCVHIAYRGRELSSVTQGLINNELLPEPGSISVVGVAGDLIPVHKPQGSALVPYTLWGEIAFQIGGESLYREVEEEAGSYAAPGRNYFDKVLADRKVLIMLDELAQYAARLEAARPDGANQLAAFLMALHGFARNRAGVAIVLTLASASDAFARQTQRLAELVGQVRGEEISEADALGIGERAVKGVASVVARDAVQITPVQAGEISSVLAKRLFTSIDRAGAGETAEAYMDMYRRNSPSLPEEAAREDFKDRMLSCYPFHPTLVDFLNKKLADAENFQGTRGVLRVLSLAVRRLWESRQQVPMIHACHLDLRSARVVDEILGRTGSSDLLFVLNADVGGVDTGTLEGGRSNAELADRANQHPMGYPFYEYTWKTVFLHSLVGREQGRDAAIFGLTEPEALFAVSFPGLTPPQVRTALEEIVRSAFYLRLEQGKYYASEQPTINSILARIRKTISKSQVEDILKDTSRKIVTSGSRPFQVINDVELPEDLPDGKGRPLLGIVSLTAQSVDVDAMVTTKGPNKPREQQNLVFLLVPETVTVKLTAQQELFLEQNSAVQEARQRLEFLARQVKAMRMLIERPHNYGVNPARLEDEDFKINHAQAELDLQTSVAGKYTSLYYPSAGEIKQREIKTGGGEGGAPFIELILQVLQQDGKLLGGSNTTQADLINLSKLFFASADTAKLETLRHNFFCVRSWPVLEDPNVFEQIIRAGVSKGVWCLYRMGSAESTRPDEFYDRDSDIPMGVNLASVDYGIVTLAGANQRNWSKAEQVDPAQVQKEVTYSVEEKGAATVEYVLENVKEKYGEVADKDIKDAVVELARKERIYAYHGTVEQSEKPDLIHGTKAILYVPEREDVLITPARAAERGWINVGRQKFSLSGKRGADKLFPLLRRLGGIYNRGAKSAIESMDIVDLRLPAGGMLRLQLSSATPEAMRSLGELFEVLAGVVERDERTEAFLDILDPSEGCLLIKELKDQTDEV